MERLLPYLFCAGALLGASQPAHAVAPLEKDSLFPLYSTASTQLGLDWHTTVGHTYELVYDGDDKLSELVWDIPYVFMIDLKLKHQIFDRLSLHLNAAHRLGAAQGEVTDSDWSPDTPGNPMTAYSEGNAQLTTGKQYDALMEYTFLKHQPHTPTESSLLGVTESIELGLLGGYRYREWRWRYSGGIQYDNPGGVQLSLYKDYVTLFDPNTVGIRYGHRMQMPFVGTKAAWKTSRLRLEGLAIFSPFTNNHDVDHHRYRDLLFNDIVKDAKYLELGLDARYLHNQSLELTFGYRYDQLFEKRGDIKVMDLETGNKFTFPESAGIAYNAHSVNAGFIYHY